MLEGNVVRTCEEGWTRETIVALQLCTSYGKCMKFMSQVSVSRALRSHQTAPSAYLRSFSSDNVW